jgi:hypothetical protein
MKRLAAFALIVAGLALPVCAQRATAHSGFSSHSAQPSHRSFGAPGLNRQAGPSRSSGARPVTVARGPQRSGNSGGRGDGPEGRRHRRPYISPYGTVIPYAYPGWVGPYQLGYGDTTSTDDSAAPPNQNAEGPAGESDAPPVEAWQPPPRVPYQPPADLPSAAPAQASEEAVTIIFKDGRQPEQIHNYILTRETLFVGDSSHREIPTDQLDLTATAKVNQDAGIDFRLPDLSR